MLVDILRRAKVNVTVASVEKSRWIIGSQNIKLMVDSSITDSSKSTYDLIILPVRQSLLPSSLCLEHFILIIMNFFVLIIVASTYYLPLVLDSMFYKRRVGVSCCLWPVIKILNWKVQPIYSVRGSIEGNRIF